MTSGPTLGLDLLHRLLACHSTPGDEEEVAALMLDAWGTAGLATTRYGKYAISARPAADRPGAPVMLVCAHMDSPGFIVERIEGDRLGLLDLGGVSFEREARSVLKTRDRKHEVTVRRTGTDEGDRDASDCGNPAASQVRCGDRVCYKAEPQVVDGSVILSPFLDNRLGCAVLCDLARHLPRIDASVNVVLGATSCEEFGGFGAPVLARAVRPDVVVCVDATYEAREQGVVLGGGPVLTVSDASVVLSPAVRDEVLGWFADRDIPLQTEVYNVSGTDSRAFPQAGLPCPVFPLLIATRGNHSPQETACLVDAQHLLTALIELVKAPPSTWAPTRAGPG